jgi:hypothetical protein
LHHLFLASVEHKTRGRMIATRAAGDDSAVSSGFQVPE